MRKAVFSLTSVLFLCLATTGVLQAQSDGRIHLPPSISQGPGMQNVPVRSGDDIQREQARNASLQRLAEIKRDTDKMLQLSAELDKYLVDTGQGVMSMDAIKKAEQIEKLAHSVKTKMKQAF